MVRGAADPMRDDAKRKSSLGYAIITQILPTVTYTTVSNDLGIGLITRDLVKRLSATNPLSEKTLIDHLDRSSRAWEACILASSKWPVLDQNYLVSTLDAFKKDLSVIASYSHRNCC